MELTISSGLSFVETWLSGRKQQFAKLPWGSSPPCVQIAPFPPTSKFDGSLRRYHPGTRPPLSGGATSCSSVGSSTALLMLGSWIRTPPRRPYMGVWRNWRDAADSKSATMIHWSFESIYAHQHVVSGTTTWLDFTQPARYGESGTPLIQADHDRRKSGICFCSLTARHLIRNEGIDGSNPSGSCLHS